LNALSVATPRLHFFCRAYGEPDGIPVILLHGSYGTSRWWDRFAAVLPEQFYAVAPDLRGCGSSEKTETGYDIPGQADDLDGLVQALQWDEFHLVAHSSSGAIAIEYALSHPEILTTLTLVDSVPVEGVFTPIDTYLLLEQMKHDRALLRSAVLALMPSLPLGDPTEHAGNIAYVELLVDDAQQMAPAAFTEVARALGAWNRFSDARHLTLPTLLVWGDRDIIVEREATTRTLIAIPGAANLEILHGVGHSPMIEAPAAFSSRFVDFVVQDFDDFAAVRRSLT
jgi:pimeloyl-ACP methyl ester carboxylesterase